MIIKYYCSLSSVENEVGFGWRGLLAETTHGLVKQVHRSWRQMVLALGPALSPASWFAPRRVASVMEVCISSSTT